MEGVWKSVYAGGCAFEGLARDDSPLISCHRSDPDIYALDWKMRRPCRLSRSELLMGVGPPERGRSRSGAVRNSDWLAKAVCKSTSEAALGLDARFLAPASGASASAFALAREPKC
jgi:hypothetical protein